jgi:hypothetical protein
MGRNLLSAQSRYGTDHAVMAVAAARSGRDIRRLHSRWRWNFPRAQALLPPFARQKREPSGMRRLAS